MSFGRPPSINVGFQVTAPDRGSFPLDHFGGYKMTLYMKCLRENGNDSSPCRTLTRDYLDCRMQKGLMEKDEWKNLGLANLKGDKTASDSAPSSPPDSTTNPPNSK
ncbi:COX19 [Coprinopsis cinerea okayama7|uniref:COX19 n=1 Tax=Coprinopsis cinerea (strain Okayama-7 / 130 / ATCC MYA-4618 / FGSC 9003) TaxID=240176 RepID=A8N183_COPC7|nr:COX19 [Coprinopsis cinerea okayama7\|eukprot:XP_001828632.1 COX19 [Coprinopsis cinerea okayama7\